MTDINSHPSTVTTSDSIDSNIISSNSLNSKEDPAKVKDFKDHSKDHSKDHHNSNPIDLVNHAHTLLSARRVLGSQRVLRFFGHSRSRKSPGDNSNNITGNNIRNKIQNDINDADDTNNNNEHMDKSDKKSGTKYKSNVNQCQSRRFGDNESQSRDKSITDTRTEPDDSSLVSERILNRVNQTENLSNSMNVSLNTSNSIENSSHVSIEKDDNNNNLIYSNRTHNNLKNSLKSIITNSKPKSQSDINRFSNDDINLNLNSDCTGSSDLVLLPQSDDNDDIQLESNDNNLLDYSNNSDDCGDSDFDSLDNLPLDPILLLKELKLKQFTLEAVQRNLQNISALHKSDRAELEVVKRVLEKERRMRIDKEREIVRLKETNLMLQKKVVRMREEMKMG